MDKLSEHAIRMLEIADKPYWNEYNMVNKDLKDTHDIARAVYDIILQVQMLKTELRHKTEPNCSEKPNNCDTCANGEGDIEACGYCRHGDLYEPKTEPRTDIEIARAIVHKAIDDTAIAEDAYPDLRQKMHDAVDNYEPQTDCAWKKGK